MVSVQAPADIHVQLEAFGSGVLLHEDLAIAADKAVADLRRLVLSSGALPSRTRGVRLFVDHGGAELDDDATLIADTPLATNVDHKPLVAFPKLCK